MRAFLCHSSDDKDFALQVSTYLKKNLEDVFCYEEHQKGDKPWQEGVDQALESHEVLVIFVGKHWTSYQQGEVNAFRGLKTDEDRAQLEEGEMAGPEREDARKIQIVFLEGQEQKLPQGLLQLAVIPRCGLTAGTAPARSARPRNWSGT